MRKTSATCECLSSGLFETSGRRAPALIDTAEEFTHLFNAPSPFAQLVTFDFPNTSRCCTLRERSNTPLQALNLLNDPVFHQAAQSLATKILESDFNDESQRLNFAFMKVISRPASEKEADILLDYLHQQREWFLEDASRVQDFYETTSVPNVPEDHAAWSMLASVIMNLDEAITRE